MLTTTQKTGIIVGVILFTLAVITIVLFWYAWYRKNKPPDTSKLVTLTRSEPNGTTMSLAWPHQGSNPRLLESSAYMIGGGELPRTGPGIHRGLPQAALRGRG